MTDKHMDEANASAELSECADAGQSVVVPRETRMTDEQLDKIRRTLKTPGRLPRAEVWHVTNALLDEVEGLKAEMTERLKVSNDAIDVLVDERRCACETLSLATNASTTGKNIEQLADVARARITELEAETT